MPLSTPHTSIECLLTTMHLLLRVQNELDPAPAFRELQYRERSAEVMQCHAHSEINLGEEEITYVKKLGRR